MSTKRSKKKVAKKQANQYAVDPRQALFLSYYLDPKSETFSNALQSAIRAGYTQEYSESITAQMPMWFSEFLGEQKMLHKAERNLDNVLDLEVKEAVIAMFGPVVSKETGEVLTKVNPNLLRIKADVSKFIAERLGKKKYGTDDKPQGNTYNFIFTNEQREAIARRILARRGGTAISS